LAEVNGFAPFYPWLPLKRWEGGETGFLLSVEESRKRAKELVEFAVDAIRSFGPEAEPLRELAWFILAREY
jgi:hypothetical protein